MLSKMFSKIEDCYEHCAEYIAPPSTTRFQVGLAIPMVERRFLPFTTSSKRTTFPPQEILGSYARNAREFNTLKAAKKYAKEKAERALREQIPATITGQIRDLGKFDKFECAIFELEGSEIIKVHFRGRECSYEELHAASEQPQYNQKSYKFY